MRNLLEDEQNEQKVVKRHDLQNQSNVFFRVLKRSYQDRGYRSAIALNLANAFAAGISGISMPMIADLLKSNEWRPFHIGLVTALSGLGAVAAPIPIGILIDRLSMRRSMFVLVSLIVGLCYLVLPRVTDHIIFIGCVLFLLGILQSTFMPLLGTLALSLVGRERLEKTTSINQVFNHLGILLSSLGWIVVLKYGGLNGVFIFLFFSSGACAIIVLFISRFELDPTRERSHSSNEGTHPKRTISDLLKNKNVRILIGSTILFHLANAPVMPLVAQHLLDMGAEHHLVAQVVLWSQAVMIIVSFLTGWMLVSWGRKMTFGIAFLVLSVRIFLYTLASKPEHLITIQLLDGVGAGIFGVVILPIAADLTAQKGGFNTLLGIIGFAISCGGLFGPIIAGSLVEFYGYNTAYYCLTVVALLGTFLWSTWRSEHPSKTP